MICQTAIRGGTLVTPRGVIHADLGIAGGRIVATGPDVRAEAEIDATDRLVIPGAVDPHVHLQMPAGAFTSSDDWTTGTIAAACGGTTTVIDFVEPDGQELLPALAARRAEAEGQAVIDFGLHMTLCDARPETLAQIPAVVAAGCPSFKTYLTYEGFNLDDAELLAALDAVGAAGGIVLVHAENDAMIRHAKRRLLDAGLTGPRWHGASRPAAAEGEAVERALALAEVAGCPLYVVHVSTGRGAAAVARARGRGQQAWGETCPQYLLLTSDASDLPGFEGARFICSPPLRGAEDNAALWDGLAAGELAAVGTDHCPFLYEGQKDLGCRVRDATLPLPSFDQVPGGMPGIELRLALLYTYGVAAGRLTLERWVEVCCSAPARLFGLAGRKGVLAPGADADIVVFDPRRAVTVSRGLLHERCDYTPYEGMRLTGYPELTLRRGRIIARDGQFVGAAGGGRFLPGLQQA